MDVKTSWCHIAPSTGICKHILASPGVAGKANMSGQSCTPCRTWRQFTLCKMELLEAWLMSNSFPSTADIGWYSLPLWYLATYQSAVSGVPYLLRVSPWGINIPFVNSSNSNLCSSGAHVSVQVVSGARNEASLDPPHSQYHMHDVLYYKLHIIWYSLLPTSTWIESTVQVLCYL